MLRLLFKTHYYGSGADIFLLIARLLSGYAMMMHGSGKIGNPLAWMGEDSSFPAFFQFLGAFAEFGGGIAIMLGLLTRLSAFGITCTMIVAVWMHGVEFGDPFVNMTGGGSYEMATLFLLLAGMFLVFGPGRFSADHLIERLILKNDMKVKRDQN